MRRVLGVPRSGTSESDGQVSQSTDTADRIVQTPAPRRVTHINGERIRFKDLARFAWPDKTEAHLAFLLKVDARTARRWLADDTEPPADALGAILAEIMKRFHQR